MTAKAITFDTAANNTQIATSGSYGGSTIDLYSESAGGDMFVSTAQAAHGAASARFTSTGATSVTLIRLTGFTGKKLGTAFALRLDALPSTETILGQIRHATGVLAQVQVDTSGIVKFVAATSGVLFQSTAISINTWYRVGMWMENGTTSTNGKLKGGVYVGDTTTTVGSAGSSTTANFGTLADVASFQVGKPAGTGAAINGYLDTIRADDAATDLLGPYALAAPVLTIPAAQTVREIQSSATNGGVVTLTTDVGSPEDPVSITGPDGSGWFRVILPDPMTGDIELTMTATNSGGTDTEAVVITQSSGAVVRRDFLAFDGAVWS